VLGLGDYNYGTWAAIGDKGRWRLGTGRRVESWRDLDVWEVAHKLVLRVYETARQFPADERFRLADQLCRAATSIPTNIAEGKGRGSLKEYLQFLIVARGSVEELKYQLLLARDLGYIGEGPYHEMTEGYERVGKMLNGLIRSLGARSRA